MSEMWVPELLSPAGNLEKLKLAINYGANAVYLGGQQYGLRSAADNFTWEEITVGVNYAHQHNAKVFVVLNSFLHDEDFDALKDFIIFLDQQDVDAVIVSDLGVINWVKQYSTMDIHLSTQASCLNAASAQFWKEQGIKRVILGREVSLVDAERIRQLCGLEVEMFIHGSMCMSYSGNCVISNFTQGRDSNRGGCAHSCRFEYSLYSENTSLDDFKESSFFMSSKDLQGLALLEQYRNKHIDSIKIEGRMKSYLHVVTLTKVYAQALKILRQEPKIPTSVLNALIIESSKISHRTYCQGSLVSPAGAESVHNEREGEDIQYQLVGEIIAKCRDKMVIAVRAAFVPGETLEVIAQHEDGICFRADQMTNFYGEPILKTKPGSVVFLPLQPRIQINDIVRKYIGMENN